MRYHKPKGAVSCQGKEVFLTFSLFDKLRPIKVLGWVVKETENDSHIDTHVTFMFLPTRDEEMILDFVRANGINMVHSAYGSTQQLKESITLSRECIV